MYGVAVGDLDNDGDMDVVSGDYLDNVYVWQNTLLHRNAVFDSTNYETTIDGEFNGAYSVFAADIDGDGDMDVLGAANEDDDIAWWENDGSPGGADWTETTIDGDFDATADVHAADIDGDGDLDVLGAAAGADADDITWWKNIGGSAGYTVTDTAPASMAPSDKDDVLKVVVAHNGITGDNNLEIESWNILFEETDGDPLTDTEAESIFADLWVYNDDGGTAGTWDGTDTIAYTLPDITIDGSGYELFDFADDDNDFEISTATGSKTYFLVIEMTGSGWDVNQFRVTFDPDANALNEDYTEDTSVSVADTLETAVSVPEFPTMAVPVAGVVLLFGLARRRRGRR